MTDQEQEKNIIVENKKVHDAFLDHNFCKYDDCPFQKVVHAHEEI